MRFDPFGFALEKYDAIGRLRVKDLGGLAVDTKVRLRDMGAKTSTLDSKTNQIYLITAEQAPPPPGADNAGQGGRRRGQMVPDSFSILVVGK